MTPIQLLDLTISGFPILLIDDVDMLNGALLRALTTYQTKFGKRTLVELDVDLESGLSSSLPDDYLQRICLTDALGQHYFSQNTLNGELKVLKVSVDKRMKLPVKLLYFVALAGDEHLDKELPPESIPMLQDYLDVLIRIMNNEVRSALSARNEVVDPTVEDHAMLLTRKRELEDNMSASAPPLPMMSSST
jgi:hypothetical protein